MLIFDTMQAFQRTMALKTAVELDIFTRIAEGATSAAEIARRVNASERGIRILCDFLTIEGFLTKQDNTYALTPDSNMFLNTKSPAYMGSIGLFLAHPMQVEAFMHLTDIVRRGGAAPQQDVLGIENPIWVEFARYMAPISAMGAAAIAEILANPGQPMKVLDIASGPGAYGIEIARRNPKAEIYGQDWKNVLELSIENARKAGVGDRYHGIPGSAFEVDLGTGYDLILLPNFLHHFDHAANVKLLRRLRAAMKPGGRLATVEFVPNDDRISPPAAAKFSLQMLAATERGDAYTLKELEAMFRDAGFGKSEARPIPPSPETLIVTEYQ
jgi:2-polyprenyl-3-methyl-5-hydroxy-6-metoxy-1,4-benzoquinol methylase